MVALLQSHLHASGQGEVPRPRISFLSEITFAYRSNEYRCDALGRGFVCFWIVAALDLVSGTSNQQGDIFTTKNSRLYLPSESDLTNRRFRKRNMFGTNPVCDSFHRGP